MLFALTLASAFALPPDPALGPSFGKGCDLRDTHPEPRRYYLSAVHRTIDFVFRPAHSPLVSDAGVVDGATPIAVTWIENERSTDLAQYVDGVRMVRSGFLY